jgi:hypothetical protein
VQREAVVATTVNSCWACFAVVERVEIQPSITPKQKQILAIFYPMLDTSASNIHILPIIREYIDNQRIHVRQQQRRQISSEQLGGDASYHECIGGVHHFRPFRLTHKENDEQQEAGEHHCY